MKKVTDEAQHIVEQAQTQVVQYQNQYQAQCKKVEALEAQVNMLTQAVNRSINTNNMTQQHNYSIPPPNYVSNSSFDIVACALDEFDQSMTKTNEYMLESLKNQASASKDYFLSNAKICDGKSPKDFSIWLGDVNRYASNTHKDPNDIALMTSQGSLYTYVKELVFSGKNWLEITPLLQSRFSECGNPTLAKHN